MNFKPTAEPIGSTANFVPTSKPVSTIPKESGGLWDWNKFGHYMNPFSKGGLGEQILSVGGDIAQPFAKASIGPILEQSGVDVSDVPYMGNIGAPKTMKEGAMAAIDVGIWAVPTGWLVKPFKLLGKTIKGIPKFLYESAFKSSKKAEQQVLKKGTKALSEELLEKGIWGTEKSLLKKSKYNIDIAEKSLYNLLKSSDEKVTRKELEVLLTPYLEKLTIQRAGNAKAYKESLTGILDDLFKGKQGGLALAEANDAKRAMYSYVKELGYLTEGKVAMDKELRKVAANSLKQMIEKKAGKEEVTTLNQLLRLFGRLEDDLTSKMATKPKSMGALDWLFLGGAGAQTGAGSSPGTLLGILAAKKASESTAVKTGTAQVINNTFKFLGKGAGLIEKTATAALEKAPTVIEKQLKETVKSGTMKGLYQMIFDQF